MSRRGRGGKNKNHRADFRRDTKGDNRQTARPEGIRPESSSQRSNPPSPRSQMISNDQQHPPSLRPHGKTSFPSITQPRKNVARPLSEGASESAVSVHPKSKQYRVIFFDTVAQAKADLVNLRDLAGQCDQLNIVVRAEGTMDDHDLNTVGRLFCGAAWTLIHERRKAEGWYDSNH